MDFEILILSSISIAVIHSLAPDHYIPIVILSRAKRMGVKVTLAMSFIAGTIHVGLSIFLALSIWRGIDIAGLAESIEGLSPVLLMGFGILYSIISLIKKHSHRSSKSIVTLLLIIGLSPCIPLIPVILLAKTLWQALIIAVVFLAGTVTTILLLTYLTYKSMRPPELIHGLEDFFAGIIISLTGLIVYIIEKIRVFTSEKMVGRKLMCYLE